ncbi:hypothetical protein CMI37_32270 [Candidatus Pacearchaeota archaeon]|nr:hypothetical protein [Candidatus Pacearchaeota archaeon]
MPKIKPQYLYPQRDKGHHGAIGGQSTEALEKDQVVIVVGRSGDRFVVSPASSRKKSLYNGFLAVADHATEANASVRCLSYAVVEMETQKGKTGDPVYLSRTGGWTLSAPKVGKKQIGTVIQLEEGKGVLLAPNVTYT